MDGTPHDRARDLAALMRPRAVAVVGASADPERIGGRALKYYRELGFAGPCYPVNPNRPEVQGLPAFPTVDAIPGSIDLAVVAVPIPEVAGALRAAAAKGAKAAVVFTAGFAETGPEGSALQHDLAATARAAGIRMLGPNCLGLYDAATGNAPTFTSAFESGRGPAGRLAFLTQSGAYGAFILALARRRGIGPALWASTGNEADVSLTDCLAYALEQPDIAGAVLYAEAIKDGPAFVAALARARDLGKPVAMIKVGRSQAGAAAAASHTASLAGSDEVYDAVLRQLGVARAETTEDLMDLAYLMHRGRLPRGRRLGILTVSGGAGVIMADAAERHGLDLPPMPAPAQARLKVLVPFGSPVNPVDVTGQATNDLDLVRVHLDAMLDEGGYDMVGGFVLSWPASTSMGSKLKDAILAATARFPDRIVAMSATAPPEVVRAYEDAGILMFEDPARLVAALAAASRLAPAPDATPHAALPPLDAIPVPRTAPDEAGAKRILASAGLALPPERLVRSAAEAARAAAGFGGPVALKVASPDILHKTDVGGVVLGVAPADAAAAYDAMMARVARAAPAARLEGALVAPMVDPVAQLIVGVRDDPTFGPVVMTGFGGVFAEVVRDVALRLAPVDEADALAMLRALKAFPLLDGARGRPRADVAAAARAISLLSRYAAQNTGRFASIEVNPLAVMATGQGALMLDALIVPAAPA